MVVRLRVLVSALRSIAVRGHSACCSVAEWVKGGAQRAERIALPEPISSPLRARFVLVRGMERDGTVTNGDVKLGVLNWSQCVPRARATAADPSCLWFVASYVF